jgi:FkbM family methyltransferase
MKVIHRFLKRCGWELSRVPKPLAYNYHAKLRFPLGAALAYCKLTRPDFFFIQVGANDGCQEDPIFPFVERFGLRGLLLEPQPDLFKRLQQTYAHRDDVILVNAAIAAQDGKVGLHRVRADAGQEDWVSGIASFRKESLLTHRAALPQIETLIETIEVESISPESLKRAHGIKRFDLLQIDTEGFDYEVIKLFDIENNRPAVLHFEHRHLARAEWEECIAKLVRLGYLVSYTFEDTLACLGSEFPTE